MFALEKSFCRAVFALTLGLAWLLLKTLFYTLPKKLMQAVAKNH